jgi:NAD(P)-dependent dehydrogenase (short-subunit alcohol dehydrogenase family)
MSKVWLITGSSRGLGRALGEAVLAEGHKLVATARSPAQLADLVERYRDQVRAVALDVIYERAADNAIHSAVNAFGRFDVLVNNAGYGNVSSNRRYEPRRLSRADRDQSLRRHHRHQGRDPTHA